VIRILKPQKGGWLNFHSLPFYIKKSEGVQINQSIKPMKHPFIKSTLEPLDQSHAISKAQFHLKSSTCPFFSYF
jgi:hypothetical protein